MKIIGTRVAYQGWLKLIVAAVRTPDGREVSREFTDAGPAAAVLAYDPARRTALMVRQFRAPVAYAGGPDTLLEAIAGRLDGDDPEDCARREAMEEAGVRLGALERIADVWASPGATAERASLFLAPYGLADRIGPGGGAAGEDEHIEVVELPLAELASQAAAGRIGDLIALALVLALQARRPELFVADG
jgi:nudix-type nucleoside diphosphatase (YffH/AdpP family)